MFARAVLDLNYEQEDCRYFANGSRHVAIEVNSASSLQFYLSFSLVSGVSVTRNYGYF